MMSGQIYVKLFFPKQQSCMLTNAFCGMASWSREAGAWAGEQICYGKSCIDSSALSLESPGLYMKEVPYILECSVWYFQLHRIKGSPSEKDYELGTAWLFSVSQVAMCLVWGT